MKDPCDDCLVQACCSCVCNDKLKFVDLCIRNLTNFMDHYLYDKTGTRIKIIDDPSLNTEHCRLLSICDKNQAQINIIQKRPIS